jgi:hypothetical protein
LGVEFWGTCLLPMIALPETAGFDAAIHSAPDGLFEFLASPPAGRAARILHQSFLF